MATAGRLAVGERTESEWAASLTPASFFCASMGAAVTASLGYAPGHQAEGAVAAMAQG